MIPDFQSIMLPLLEIHRDGTGKITSEIREGIISHFNISEVEQLEKIQSYWAQTKNATRKGGFFVCGDLAGVEPPTECFNIVEA